VWLPGNIHPQGDIKHQTDEKTVLVQLFGISKYTGVRHSVLLRNWAATVARILFVAMIVLVITTESKSQWLTNSYYKDAIGVQIQPMLNPKTSQFDYLVGVDYRRSQPDHDYHVAVQSIKPLRLTGITYTPKDNHVYVNLGLSKRLLNKNKGLVDRMEFIFQHEQFWNISNSSPELLITRGEWQLWSGQDVYGVEFEHQHDVYEVRSPNVEGVQPVAGTHNWGASVFVGKGISKFLFVENRLVFGEVRWSKRFTYKISSLFTLAKKAKVGLAAEYNKLTGLSPLNGFYITLTADIALSKELGCTSIAFYDMAKGISASLVGLELKKRSYRVQLQYRVVRDQNYKALVISDPFFASSVLLKIAAPIHVR
jgi:hypothetical protein